MYRPDYIVDIDDESNELVIASKSGDLQKVIELIDFKDFPQSFYNLALIIACKYGHTRLVIHLCNIGIWYKTNNYAPLRTAIKYGHKDIIAFLLPYGYGNTSFLLELAAESGRLYILDYLMTNGVTVTYYDQPLTIAVKYNHFHIVKYLIENGEERHNFDRTLLYASENGNLRILNYLLTNGTYGESKINEALRYAIVNNQLEIVKYLIKKNVNKREIDKNMYIAEQKGFSEIVEYLKDEKENLHRITKT